MGNPRSIDDFSDEELGSHLRAAYTAVQNMLERVESPAQAQTAVETVMVYGQAISYIVSTFANTMQLLPEADPEEQAGFLPYVAAAVLGAAGSFTLQGTPLPPNDVLGDFLIHIGSAVKAPPMQGGAKSLPN